MCARASTRCWNAALLASPHVPHFPPHLLPDTRSQEAKALREYEELKECTFTPELNARSRAAVASGAAAAPAGPAPLAALSGVARHLEQLAMARRRKEEQREVEDRVWWRTPRGSTALFTVPQPFSFDQGGQGPPADG